MGPTQGRRQPQKEQGRVTKERAMEVVKRWEELQLVEKAWIIHGQPCWIWLSNEGLRFVSEQLGDLRAYAPTPGRLNHLYAVNLARLIIEGRRMDATWLSERELKGSMKVETGKRPHTPDAILVSNGRKIAVEVELTTKSYERLSKILHELALNAEYYTIWYFCRGRSLTVMNTAIGNMKEMYKGKFVVYDLDELQKQL
jgi:hypothetical protein